MSVQFALRSTPGWRPTPHTPQRPVNGSPSPSLPSSLAAVHQQDRSWAEPPSPLLLLLRESRSTGEKLHSPHYWSPNQGQREVFSRRCERGSLFETTPRLWLTPGRPSRWCAHRTRSALAVAPAPGVHPLTRQTAAWPSTGRRLRPRRGVRLSVVCWWKPIVPEQGCFQHTSTPPELPAKILGDSLVHPL